MNPQKKLEVLEKTKGHVRHPQWSRIRKQFLLGKVCAVCGGKKSLEAHHIIPFHANPTLELKKSNLIALCEGKKTILCHLVIGHGGNYKDVNPYCKETAAFLKWLLTTKQLAERALTHDIQKRKELHVHFNQLLKKLP